MKGVYHLFFETLSTKLKIDILTKLKEKPYCVTSLADQLHQERSKVSHALLSLLECSFVTVEKKGKQRIYYLNMDTIQPLLNLVETHVRKYCKTCKKVKEITNYE
jgi:DNA-binding transcriptional ArsR family regulator